MCGSTNFVLTSVFGPVREISYWRTMNVKNPDRLQFETSCTKCYQGDALSTGLHSERFLPSAFCLQLKYLGCNLLGQGHLTHSLMSDQRNPTTPAVGGAVAQSVERTTPSEKVFGSISAVAAHSLLVGSVSA